MYHPGLHKHEHAPEPVQTPLPEQTFDRSTQGTAVGAGVRAVGAIEGDEVEYLRQVKLSREPDNDSPLTMVSYLGSAEAQSSLIL